MVKEFPVSAMAGCAIFVADKAHQYQAGIFPGATKRKPLHLQEFFIYLLHIERGI